MSSFYVYIIFLALVYTGNVHCWNNTSKRRLFRNFGGRQVEIGDLPHHVFFYVPCSVEMKYYRAFCGGNIITRNRVLTSSYCFIRNSKKEKRALCSIYVVAASVETIVTKPQSIDSPDNEDQWREIKKRYSQRLYRFPAFNLAIVEVIKDWVFNDYVQRIPYASLDQDFDGVCIGTVVKASKSWARDKQLYTTELVMMTRSDCESQFVKSMRLFYCTAYDEKYSLYSSEIQGGGLVCYETQDPREGKTGVLVGISSFAHYRMPSLYHKVAMFQQWISNSATKANFVLPFLFCVSY